MVPAPRSPINIVDEQSGHLSGTRQRFRARTLPGSRSRRARPWGPPDRLRLFCTAVLATGVLKNHTLTIDNTYCR